MTPCSHAGSVIVHERFVPFAALANGDRDAVLASTMDHVRAHVASVADADDDPTTHAAGVRLQVVEVDGGLMVQGHLDAEPDAPYLRDGYDPWAKVPPELLALAVEGGAS